MKHILYNSIYYIWRFFYFFRFFVFRDFWLFIFFDFWIFFRERGICTPSFAPGRTPARLFVKKSEGGRRRNTLILCILAVLWCKNIFLKRTFIKHISGFASDWFSSVYDILLNFYFNTYACMTPQFAQTYCIITILHYYTITLLYYNT